MSVVKPAGSQTSPELGSAPIKSAGSKDALAGALLPNAITISLSFIFAIVVVTLFGFMPPFNGITMSVFLMFASAAVNRGVGLLPPCSQRLFASIVAIASSFHLGWPGSEA